MTRLTITSRGQVTLRKDVLRHMGVQPGEKIEVDLLPDGRLSLRAATPSGGVEDFVGMLAGRTAKVASLEEIQEAISSGWSGQP